MSLISLEAAQCFKRELNLVPNRPDFPSQLLHPHLHPTPPFPRWKEKECPVLSEPKTNPIRFTLKHNSPLKTKVYPISGVYLYFLLGKLKHLDRFLNFWASVASYLKIFVEKSFSQGPCNSWVCQTLSFLVLSNSWTNVNTLLPCACLIIFSMYGTDRWLTHRLLA